MSSTYNVLFVCTGNSARSVIAEALLNAMGEGRFRGFSAGSQPGGSVEPTVLDYLAARGIPAGEARSKSWDEFAGDDAPQMDLVITVCDRAAGETCPVWPGHPACAHWSIPDPMQHREDPQSLRRAVADVFHTLQAHIRLLISLPVDTLDRHRLEHEVHAIGAGAARRQETEPRPARW